MLSWRGAYLSTGTLTLPDDDDDDNNNNNKIMMY
jgi:hypothetical protein